MTVTLVQPYDPAWPDWFQQIKAFLETGLVGVGCTFEHVGSTSIPGMVAKPVIDLDIVTEERCFSEIKARLETLGYVHLGDLGLPGREAFELAEVETKAHLPEHHLYVCEDGSYELRKHLAFRDFMRQHPEWRDRLNRLKLELCSRDNNDRQAYIDGKSEMVAVITSLAMGGQSQKG
ncbi:MAG: GrpB family protein [Candidatus Hydrogenedentes bacterium]|nr:GrpB family protein [Candidatus Hydrogenedentota bacterium]